MPARRRRGGAPAQAQGLARRPVPVLDEGNLHALHHRPLDAQVRVAPLPDARVAPEVFVADVEAADPGAPAVHHHDLAVVAEVQVQPVDAAADGRLHRDAGGPQPVDVGARQAVAADLVVQQVHPHAGGGALQQPRAQFPAHAVVAQDVELDQHVVAGRGDALEDRPEGGSTVDQQRGAVAVRERKPGEPLERLRVAARDEQAAPPQDCPHAVLRRPEGGEVLAPRRDIVVEAVLAEHQEQRQGQQRERDQGHRPRRRSLGGACLHHGLAGGQHAEHLDQGVRKSEPGAHFAASSARSSQGGS